jgi:hypothetical protein
MSRPFGAGEQIRHLLDRHIIHAQPRSERLGQSLRISGRRRRRVATPVRLPGAVLPSLFPHLRQLGGELVFPEPLRKAQSHAPLDFRQNSSERSVGTRRLAAAAVAH